MAVTDRTFNGSAVTFGGVAVAPLNDYRHTNSPAPVKQTGSTDGYHSYGVGRNNNTITIGLLGSQVPDAQQTAALAITLNASMETLSLTAVTTSVNISGRKDGEIRANLTLRPAATTATTFSGVTATNVGFDGSKIVCFGSTFGSSTGDAAIVSANYTATCAEQDDAGASDPSVIITAGLPDRTMVIEVMGGPSTGMLKGTTGTTAMTWNDGGSLGTWSNAVVMNVEDGGTLDDVVTTQYTIRQYPNVA